MPTKQCPFADCDAEIGADEKTCPKCSGDIEALESQMSMLEKAQKALEKKKKKETPAPAPAPAPAPVAKKKPGFLENF